MMHDELIHVPIRRKTQFFFYTHTLHAYICKYICMYDEKNNYKNNIFYFSEKVSESIPDEDQKVTVVPHVVRPWQNSWLHQGLALRQLLNIGAGSLVFGRYGGKDQFNIDYVSKTVK
jgi:hypothetical protein